MSIIMTESERTAFLANVHVGVLAVARDGRGPLAVPVWYAYEPGGDLQVWMERGSVKFRAIEAVGRVTFLVQTEAFPYRYVSVEGPVASIERPTRDEAIAITRRYVPEPGATAYVDTALGDDSVLVRVRPEKWLSNDQGKA